MVNKAKSTQITDIRMELKSMVNPRETMGREL
jgi:hypothetical protein